jgi:hypothetical protein
MGVDLFSLKVTPMGFKREQLVRDCHEQQSPGFQDAADLADGPLIVGEVLDDIDKKNEIK